MFEQALIIITSIVVCSSVIVALLVLLKNPHSWINRWLFCLFLTASIWIFLSSMLEYFNDGSGVWFVRSIFAAAVGLGFSTVSFARSLYRRTWISNDALLAPIGILICYLPLSIPNFFRSHGLVHIKYGPLYPVIIALILFYLINAITVIVGTFRSATGSRRIQARIILLGLGIGMISAILTNIVLPNLTHVSSSSEFAFIAILIWMGSLIYAVVRHQFLDIRPVVARAVAYLLALVTVGVVYVVLIILVGRLLIAQPSTALTPSYALLIIVISITFHPLRVFFDRFTNHIFFRDAYDPQEVLDRLSSSMAETINIDKIASSSLAILDAALKPVSLAVILVNRSTAAGHLRTYQRGREFNDVAVLYKSLNQHIDRSIILVETNDTTRFGSKLAKQEVAMVASLRNLKGRFGFLLIGYKQSGYTYNRQDKAMIRTAVSQLSIGLQNGLRFQEIKEFNETLQVRINDATEQLQETNKKLRSLDAAKDEFISMASHQLRTPLTSVKGYLSMVLEGDAGQVPLKQRQLLLQAYASAQRMVYLVSDFLNVSRLQTGRFELQLGEVQLATVIKQEIEQLEESAAARNLQFQYHQPHLFPLLRIDENKIRQVIMNILDNAIYYAHPETVIEVTLTRKMHEITFMVKDQGIGVPLAEQHRLFTKFFRASNARNARPDGTGIGLFMAKKVVLAHHGTIIFKSKEGEGSVFGFSLPNN